MPFFWVDDWAEKGFFYSANVLLTGARVVCARPVELRVRALLPEQNSSAGQKREDKTKDHELPILQPEMWMTAVADYDLQPANQTSSLFNDLSLSIETKLREFARIERRFVYNAFCEGQHVRGREYQAKDDTYKYGF